MFLDIDKYKSNKQATKCPKRTNLMNIYSLGREIIIDSQSKSGNVIRELCSMVDNVFFYNHIWLEVGSYDMNSKKSLLDEYEVNVNKNKQIITLKLNREQEERVIKIYICLNKPNFKFRIYKPSLSKSTPIEYGSWSLKAGEED